MKKSYKYILFVVALTLVCFVLGQRMPRKFTWEATFASADRQPFGCYVFDSLMSQTLRGGYRAGRRTFSQIAADASLRGCNVLVVSDNLDMKRRDFRAMDSLLRAGSKVMLVCSGTNNLQTDSMLARDYGFYVRMESGFTPSAVQRQMAYSDGSLYDTVQWRRGDRRFEPRAYRMYSQMVSGVVVTDRARRDSVVYRPLVAMNTEYDYPDVQSPYFPTMMRRIEAKARKEGKQEELVEYGYYLYDDSWYGRKAGEGVRSDVNLAATRRVGRGELIVVALPYVFTNYGALDANVSPLLMRLMTQIAGRPVLRTTSYMKTSADYDAESSPLRYIFSSPALRLAWRLAALLLLLFCVCKARRRQRVIPVVPPPVNHSLEFARLVGTLYWQRGDNADLVRKKFRMFAERVRRSVGADIIGCKPDAATIALMARRTMLDAANLEDDISRLRLDYWTEGSISDSEMRWTVDCMDRIAERL